MGSELVKTGIDAGKLAEMDLIVKECNLAALGSLGNFERAFKLANGMQLLSDMITRDMMKPIMVLMNSKLGFKTDRDPAKRDSDGKPNTAYDEPTVKRCLIEALFAGVYPVGNQFNIIAAQSYVTQEGFEHKVRSFPGVTQPNLQLSVPVTSNGGALVSAIATWSLDGVPCKLERLQGKEVDQRIVVRVNSGQGADAIFGKAKRKLWKAVFDQLIGCDSGIPDGDVSDLIGYVEPMQRPGPVQPPSGTVVVGDFLNPKGAGQKSEVGNQNAEVRDGELTADDGEGRGDDEPEEGPRESAASTQTPKQATAVELLIKNFGYLRTPVTRAQLEAFIQADLDAIGDSEILVLQEMCGECQRGLREWRAGETEPGPLGRTSGQGQGRFA